MGNNLQDDAILSIEILRDLLNLINKKLVAQDILVERFK